MNDFMKMDIFFFVTTIALVILSALLAILIIYFIKISRDVKYISQKAKTQADLISEDINDLRDNVRKGAKVKHWIEFFNNLRKKRKE